MYTRVIVVLGVCLAPSLLALSGCGDDDGGGDASNANCTPGEQSKPTGNKATDPCPQGDVASMCTPFPQFQAVTECCTAVGPGCPVAGKWKRVCQCINSAALMNGPGKAGAGGMVPMMGRCGDGVVQAGQPFMEDCDPGKAIGASCGSMGMGGGMLICDPMTCKYDTSMCTGKNGGGGAGGG